MNNANQLNLLINAAFSHARTLLLAQYSGLDAKRNQAWYEYGYKEHLTLSDYFSAYDRNALATAAVELKNDTVWSDTPYLAEGSEQDALDLDTTEEKRIARQLKKTNAWGALKQADLMRLVDGYSYLIIRIADGNGFNAPVVANALTSFAGFIPVWASQVTPEYDAKGEPISYTYKEPLKNGQLRNVKVHPDRIITFGDVRNGRSMLRSGFNNLANLEKILGGGAESFLKNAARQMNMNFDADVDLSAIATAAGLKDTTELQEVLNETVRDLNVGNDVLLTTQGAQVTPMVTSVPEPLNHFNINLQAFAASVKIPVKLLIGQITGERASTEDIKSFNKVCQAFRMNELNNALRVVFDHLAEFGFIPFDEYTIVWTDLTDGTLSERSEAASKLGAVMQAFAASEQASILTGDQPLVSREELREILGLSNDEGSK